MKGAIKELRKFSLDLNQLLPNTIFQLRLDLNVTEQRSGKLQQLNFKIFFAIATC